MKEKMDSTLKINVRPKKKIFDENYIKNESPLLKNDKKEQSPVIIEFDKNKKQLGFGYYDKNFKDITN